MKPKPKARPPQKLLVQVSAPFPAGWTIGEVSDWVEAHWCGALGEKTECIELRRDSGPKDPR